MNRLSRQAASGVGRIGHVAVHDTDETGNRYSTIARYSGL